MDRERLREQYAIGLRAQAAHRFGATRAEALAKAIEDTAGWMAEIAAFPVESDEQPAFYAEPMS